MQIGGQADFERDENGRARKLGTGYSVDPYLNVSEFKASPQCKKKLRAELDELGYEQIDLKWLVRSFAEGVYARHSGVRDVLRPSVEAAGVEVAKAYDNFSLTEGGAVRHLRLHGNGKVRPMRKDLAESALNQFSTYCSLQYASRKYISSKILEDAIPSPYTVQRAIAGPG